MIYEVLTVEQQNSAGIAETSVSNDADHKKIDSSTETHVLADVRLLGTVRIKNTSKYSIYFKAFLIYK